MLNGPDFIPKSLSVPASRPLYADANFCGKATLFYSLSFLQFLRAIRKQTDKRTDSQACYQKWKGLSGRQAGGIFYAGDRREFYFIERVEIAICLLNRDREAQPAKLAHNSLPQTTLSTGKGLSGKLILILYSFFVITQSI